MTITVPNLRDVGGLRALDGNVVAPGRLLRSALPFHDDVAPEGITWPPSLVIDLRSPMEHGQEHPLTPLGPRLVNLPLLHSLRPGWMQGASLVDLYALVLDDSAHLLVQLVREVAAAQGPTLVHCAAGKDRTGISVALVLSLLGVQVSDIEADYLRTRESLQAIDARLRRDEAAYPVNPVFHAVAADALQLVLDRWHSHPGGAVGWYESAGGTAGDVQRLRESMLGGSLS
ncbi:tyrosine-protein phosphatase [Aeromicrobium sp. CTD01-1L150]|uniref:tyrosine-protein phosphatase n=1 Tax=Aeromicrobium sp. CTD01-1L150 TaxID=3341830 RepID=UPI0035BFCF5B